MAARLKARYDSEIKGRLKEQFSIGNDFAVPRLTKIVVNMGCKGAVENKSRVDTAARDLATITGQRPTIRIARRAISGFKLREGMPIGVAVTLRRERMWEFLDRLISVALPRVRDFKGVSPKAFDGRGNFTLGVREQIIFPEIEYDRIDSVKGLNITVVTTARTDDEARALLRNLGMPFRGPRPGEVAAEGAQA